MALVNDDGDDTPPARVLAEFASGLTLDALPVRVRDRTGDLLLDALASALGGVDEPGTATVRAMAASLFGPGESTVIGGGQLCLAGATVLNAHLVSSVSLCDVHYPTWCHLTPQVVPAALAIAEQRRASGAQLLLAIAAGCELTARIGLGLNYSAFHLRGWNTSGVTGVFGAATAAGLLMGLDGTTLTHALGIAGAQAAGSDAHRGTPTVRFHQPRAALSGLMGAQLAALGFTAMSDILADPHGGLYATHSDGGTPELAVDGLGSRWEFEDIWLTQWPLALLVRNIVNVLLELRPGLELKDLIRVRVKLSARAGELYGEMPFDLPSRARTSPRYLAAVVFRDGRCGSEQFTAERIAAPELVEFAQERVQVIVDPGLTERAVQIDLELTDGTTRSHYRPVAHGDSADPLTRAEIAEKFVAAATPVLEADSITRIVDFAAGLESEPTIQPLLTALSSRREV